MRPNGYFKVSNMAEETEDIRLLAENDDDSEDPWVALRIEKSPQTLSFIQDVQSAIQQIEQRMASSPSTEPLPPLRMEHTLPKIKVESQVTDQTTLFAAKAKHLERRLSLLGSQSTDSQYSAINSEADVIAKNDNQMFSTDLTTQVNTQDENPNRETSRPNAIAPMVDRFETLPESPIKQDQETTSSAYIAPIVRQFETIPESPVKSSKDDTALTSIKPIVNHFETVPAKATVKSSMNSISSVPIASIVNHFESSPTDLPTESSMENIASAQIAPIVDHFEKELPEPTTKSSEKETSSISVAPIVDDFDIGPVSEVPVSEELAWEDFVSNVGNQPKTEEARQAEKVDSILGVNSHLRNTLEPAPSKTLYSAEKRNNEHKQTFVNEDGPIEIPNEIQIKANRNEVEINFTKAPTTPTEMFDDLTIPEIIEMEELVRSSRPDYKRISTEISHSSSEAVTNKFEDLKSPEPVNSIVNEPDLTIPYKMENEIKTSEESKEVPDSIKASFNVIKSEKIDGIKDEASTEKNQRNDDIEKEGAATQPENNDCSTQEERVEASKTPVILTTGAGVVGITNNTDGDPELISSEGLSGNKAEKIEKEIFLSDNTNAEANENVAVIDADKEAQFKDDLDKDSNSNTHTTPLTATTVAVAQFGTRNMSITSKGIGEIAVTNDSANVNKPAIIHRVDSSQQIVIPANAAIIRKPDSNTNLVDSSFHLAEHTTPLASAQQTSDISSSIDSSRWSKVQTPITDTASTNSLTASTEQGNECTENTSIIVFQAKSRTLSDTSLQGDKGTEKGPASVKKEENDYSTTSLLSPDRSSIDSTKQPSTDSNTKTLDTASLTSALLRNTSDQTESSGTTTATLVDQSSVDEMIVTSETVESSIITSEAATSELIGEPISSPITQESKTTESNTLRTETESTKLAEDSSAAEVFEDTTMMTETTKGSRYRYGRILRKPSLPTDHSSKSSTSAEVAKENIQRTPNSNSFVEDEVVHSNLPTLHQGITMSEKLSNLPVVPQEYDSLLTPVRSPTSSESTTANQWSESGSSPENSSTRTRLSRFSVSRPRGQITSPSSTPRPSRQFRITSPLQTRRLASASKPPLQDSSPKESGSRLRNRFASRFGSSPNSDRSGGSPTARSRLIPPSLPRVDRRSPEPRFANVPRVGELPPSSLREFFSGASTNRVPRRTTFNGVTPRGRSSLASPSSRPTSPSTSPVSPQPRVRPSTLGIPASPLSAARQTVQRSFSFAQGRRATTSGIPQPVTSNSKQMSQSSRLSGDGSKRFGMVAEVGRRSSFSVTQSRSRFSSGRPRVTIPEPFHLAGPELQERLEMQMEEQRRKAEVVEKRRRVFKARPMPDFSNPSPKPKPLR